VTVAARRPPPARPWLAAGPPLLTLALALWGITGPSYWRDEAATLAATGRPFGRMIAMLGHVDAVHGAYYVLMWPVVRLGGTGELTTRLPSALAMAAATAGVVAIGQRLAGRAAGLVAGLVSAVLPEVSWFAQDARSYAIVTALAVAASYLLLRVLDSGGQRRWLLAYAAGLAVLGLFNIFSLLLVPAHAVTVALTARAAAPARRLWVVQIHEDRPVLLLGQLGFRLGETWREGDLRLALYARQGGRAA
jgi:mannosyltransferase